MSQKMAELLHITLLNPVYKDSGNDVEVNSKPIQCEGDVATERTPTNTPNVTT